MDNTGNFEEYGYTGNGGTEDTGSREEMLRLNAGDMSELCRRFSGLGADGKPKASASYCAYCFESGEDDPEKDTVYFTDITKAELSIDRATGFYTLDLSFRDAGDTSLKLLWARLQRHKSNLTYLGDKTWIFYIKLIEETSINGTGLTADILNPLVYSLVRRVPDEDVPEYEAGQGAFTGGNTVRFLLHPDLVTFQYEDIPEDGDIKATDLSEDGNSGGEQVS